MELTYGISKLGFLIVFHDKVRTSSRLQSTSLIFKFCIFHISHSTHLKFVWVFTVFIHNLIFNISFRKSNGFLLFLSCYSLKCFHWLRTQTYLFFLRLFLWNLFNCLLPYFFFSAVNLSLCFLITFIIFILL